MIKNIVKYVCDSDYRFIKNAYGGMYKSMPDEEYLKRMFKAKLHYELNLDNPKSFNEKLQWMKLHDHNPLYPRLVDKYEAKQYISDTIGKEFVIPALGVWDRVEDIDFSGLPDQFVLKCTHDSGGHVICTDKKAFDIASAKKKIEKFMKRNYYWIGREWAYKNVKPRVLAEAYMVDESGTELKDYKFFCFNGEPKYIQVDFNRMIHHKKNVYNTEWELQDFSINYPSDRAVSISKPPAFNKMVEFSKILSHDFVFARVDFYSVYDKVFVGEITFYPGSGFLRFSSRQIDRQFGELIHFTI